MKLDAKWESKVRNYLNKTLTRYSDADPTILSDYIIALLQKDASSKTQMKNNYISELSAFMNDKTNEFVEELFKLLEPLIEDKQNNNEKDSIVETSKIKRRVEIRNEKENEPTVLIAHITNDDSKNDINNNDYGTSSSNSNVNHNDNTGQPNVVTLTTPNTTSPSFLTKTHYHNENGNNNVKVKDFANVSPSPPRHDKLNSSRSDGHQDINNNIDNNENDNDHDLNNQKQTSTYDHNKSQYHSKYHHQTSLKSSYRPSSNIYYTSNILQNQLQQSQLPTNVNLNGIPIAHLLSLAQSGVQPAHSSTIVPTSTIIQPRITPTITHNVQQTLSFQNNPLISSTLQGYINSQTSGYNSQRSLPSHIQRNHPYSNSSSSTASNKIISRSQTQPISQLQQQTELSSIQHEILKPPIPQQPQIVPPVPIITTTAIPMLQSQSTSHIPQELIDKQPDEIGFRSLPTSDEPFYQDNIMDINDDKNNTTNKNHDNNRKIRKNNFNFNKQHNNNNMKNTNKNNRRNTKETKEEDKKQLYVYNVPPHLNSMEQLTKHFGQFGDIEHIQVHRNENKAYVQYSNHEDAFAALSCPEPVLDDNRIEIVWAHYNRRDFERKAKTDFAEPSTTISATNLKSDKKIDTDKNFDADGQTDLKKYQWVSDEYRAKTQPPLQTQMFRQTSSQSTKEDNKNKVEENKKISKTNSQETENKSKTKIIKIPTDKSKEIEQLKKVIEEQNLMLQTLEGENMDDNTNEEKKEANELIERIKNNLKTTEESLKNLTNKQNMRQTLLQKIKQKTALSSTTHEAQNSPAKMLRGNSLRRPGGRMRKLHSNYYGYYGYPTPYYDANISRGRGRGRVRIRSRGTGTPTAKTTSGRGIHSSPHDNNKINVMLNEKLEILQSSEEKNNDKSKVVLIEGLPSNEDSNEADLRAHFERFGKVKEVDFLTRTTARVVFQNASDALIACQQGTKYCNSEYHEYDIKLKCIDANSIEFQPFSNENYSNTFVIEEHNDNNNNNNNNNNKSQDNQHSNYDVIEVSDDEIHNVSE